MHLQMLYYKGLFCYSIFVINLFRSITSLFIIDAVVICMNKLPFVMIKSYFFTLTLFFLCLVQISINRFQSHSTCAHFCSFCLHLCSLLLYLSSPLFCFGSLMFTLVIFVLTDVHLCSLIFSVLLVFTHVHLLSVLTYMLLQCRSLYNMP